MAVSCWVGLFIRAVLYCNKYLFGLVESFLRPCTKGGPVKYTSSIYLHQVNGGDFCQHFEVIVYFHVLSPNPSSEVVLHLDFASIRGGCRPHRRAS